MKIEHVAERVVHIGTTNIDKEGTTAIVNKYGNLLKKTKEARVGQMILSGIYQCLEPGANDTEIRGGWQSIGW